ncbi:hypothetical protein OAQ99_04040 [Candidatus Kapabacteria bacterium]|nr:hypothetical protein [Candidatus Kapabacteria bacterium]
MVLKILLVIISLLSSYGFTLMIIPHFGVYIKSDIILNILQIVYTIIGFGVIYNILNKNISFVKNLPKN